MYERSYHSWMTWDKKDLQIGAMPLWAQIADRFRSAIETGEFVEGMYLPSEAQLVARFRISRATARNGLNHLASEGLVSRSSGKGTTVLPDRVEQPLNLLTSFHEDMDARGFTPGYQEISVAVDTVDQTVADALGINAGAQSIRVERLLLANGVAIAHSTSWLSPTFVTLDELPAVQKSGSSSLYAWLEEVHQLKITHGTEIIEAKVADARLAKQLDIPRGEAVLDARRTARTEDGRTIEYVQRQYRADRYRYRIELVRP